MGRISFFFFLLFASIILFKLAETYQSWALEIIGIVAGLAGGLGLLFEAVGDGSGPFG